MLDLVQRRVRDLDLRIPRDADALIDEAAFEVDEFLPYWAELWPSALALADVVARDRPTGRVLELGCGLGVPALVAARGGADVTAADWSDDAIALLADNAARNGLTLQARHWDWTGDPADLDGPFDVVLAADVLYEARNVTPVLAALDALLARDGEVWLADPGRPALPEFLAQAERAWTRTTSGRVTVLRRASAPLG